jgi:U3 small nucleolar RNA-associated protein 14
MALRTCNVGSGRKVTVEELIASTGVSIGQSGDLKAVEKLSKKLKPLEAPLPGPIQARAERRAAYDESKKDIKKWMPLVKSQREAPTLQLTSGRMDAQRPTSVSAMAAKHTPENKMELEVAAMLEAAGAHTASAVAESEEALAMRMLNAEEAKARREELAKQRALLFYHEVKAKRLKKIKSKEYRRRLKKAEKKRQDGVGEDGMLMLGDDELRQQREDAEYERAKERLTLKHKNTSRFIRRAIKRGSQHPDEGTREAIAEQLRLGDEIRRKVHAFKGESEGDSSEGSDDDSSDDERQNERLSRKLESAARDVLEDDDRPDAEKGLLSLPFMKRSMEKQKQRAQQQARKVLHGDTQGNDDDDDDTGDQVRRGRLKFGNGANRSDDANLEEDFNIDDDDDDDDVEEDAEAKRVRLMSDGSRKATKAVAKASSVAKTDSHDTRSFIPSKTFQGMKDGYVFTKGSNGMGYYAEKRNGAASASNNKLSKPSMPKMPKPQKHSTKSKKVQQQQHGGFSQEDLIRKAFAGDDVVDEFKKSKAEEVEAELPQEEVPGELPGWGTWSNPNKKEPAWVTEAKAKAEAKKAAAAKARKDASMEFVVISEKWDSKNASKYKTQSVPYPFNSKDTYERSMRQPLGKDFNTVDSFRNLTRPAVVKDSGVIIEPLQFSKSVGNHNVGVKMSQRPGIIKVAGGMAKRSGVGR